MTFPPSVEDINNWDENNWWDTPATNTVTIDPISDDVSTSIQSTKEIIIGDYINYTEAYTSLNSGDIYIQVDSVGGGGLTVSAADGLALDLQTRLLSVESGTNSFAVNRDGAPLIKVGSAPADDDIQYGQCAIWFDATNGAAKVKFKARQANGTIRTGEVALT